MIEEHGLSGLLLSEFQEVFLGATEKEWLRKYPGNYEATGGHGTYWILDRPHVAVSTNGRRYIEDQINEALKAM